MRIGECASVTHVVLNRRLQKRKGAEGNEKGAKKRCEWSESIALLLQACWSDRISCALLSSDSREQHFVHEVALLEALVEFRFGVSQ